MSDDNFKQEITVFSLFSWSLFIAVLCLSRKPETPHLGLVWSLLGFTLLAASFFFCVVAAYYWYRRATWWLGVTMPTILELVLKLILLILYGFIYISMASSLHDLLLVMFICYACILVSTYLLILRKRYATQ